MIQGFNDNYVLVDVISIAKTTTDSSGKSSPPFRRMSWQPLRLNLEGYAERINDGKASFDDIYLEYNKEINE